MYSKCLSLIVPFLFSLVVEANDCIDFQQEPYDQQFQFKIGDALLDQMPDDAIIAAIDVRIFNIFNENDPEEDTWYGRAANKLHILTRENVILDRLLFEIGENWSAEAAVESERLLRSSPYLYDVKIRPIRICGNRVTVQVLARDVWTLTGGVGLSRSGGENDTSVSISDRNFLGTGTHLSIGKDKDSERTTSFVTFSDPNLFGSRWQLKTTYNDSDDGDRKFLSISRPFYSFDTSNSYRFSASQDERIDSLYFRNIVFEKFNHQLEIADISLGKSDGEVEQQVLRWEMGWHFEEHVFEANELTQNLTEIASDRDRSFVWFGFDSIENYFMESQHFNQIGQTEDIFLGQRINGRLGYGNDFWYLATQFQDSHQVNEKVLAFNRLSGSGYWLKELNNWENMVLEASSRLLYNPFADSQWLLSGTIKYSKNLTRDHQLLLGGDNGLRGYPARYQLGSRSYLLTLEKRYFLDWQLWGILNFGIAAFMDVGRAWFPAEDNGVNGGTLSDLGVGLRITSSRFKIDRVLHIDLAFPMGNDDPLIDSVQLLISGKARF